MSLTISPATKMVYEAGSDEHHRYIFRIQTGRIPSRSVSAVLRFMEFWADEHCNGPWRADQTEAAISLSVDDGRDAAMFQLSEIYDRLQDVLEIPPPK